MPERIITKPPSAELKPNQTDQDSLPPYDELDAILTRLIEGEAGIDDVVAGGLTAPRCCGCGSCWTAPNTNAARPRPASKSPPAPSAATAAIP